MLVLNRKINEEIMIDKEISIKILGIRGNQVHVGIEAPRTVTVHRREIYLKIQNQEKFSC